MATSALIPAGGLSRRMGRPKLALPVGGRTVLEQVVAALRRGGVGTILTVLGPQNAALQPLAEQAGATVLLLPAATPDMRATIEHGLRWLEEVLRPAAADHWLLVPADHPTLQPPVVQQLQDAQTANPARSIFIPTYQGQRGHPTLIGWAHVAGIRALPADQGLNTYFRQQRAQTQEVPVETAEVLLDLDTPADYERLLRDWPGR